MLFKNDVFFLKLRNTNNMCIAVSDNYNGLISDNHTATITNDGYGITKEMLHGIIYSFFDIFLCDNGSVKNAIQITYGNLGETTSAEAFVTCNDIVLKKTTVLKILQLRFAACMGLILQISRHFAIGLENLKLVILIWKMKNAIY
ncbi:hypothetical protein HZH66_014037 [Vespula vulgaris]|uniref:Uncharacterized protein n=1 Tax=Vespula vulgaris TaxID=7454 RepID=A0A834J495_VESVU|nr:hypothetical protein HZH66_014037 [Vespula vulgaris]